ncbi:MAG: core-2/I-branching enzyme [Chroococcidiopsidaceae cyanobacterium CP_BM_ER_R8_30]|nr:core-2/I-branching enzyme [Chroococcidiopsidaceae cyanobacterium CP_BM_ER_R8_30]
MKVLYLIQTYKNPEQIYRLVQIIKKSSPGSYILVSHNFAYSHLDVGPIENLPEVEVIKGKGGRGDFSLMQGYLDAVDWLLSNNIEFDWLINLTGQDYPTQPLTRLEKFLSKTNYDGFLEYFDLFSDYKYNFWDSREVRGRYLYNYWWLSGTLSVWQRALIKLPRIIINNVQPFVRINSGYGLMVGVRATSSPYNKKFLCYRGSYFHTLSKKCIQYLNNFSKQNFNLISYYKKTCLPEESLIQTVLVNSKLFNLCNDYKRYIDWNGSRHGHPRLITVEDYPVLIKDNIHFARKFDTSQDSKILDMLDARILQNSKSN